MSEMCETTTPKLQMDLAVFVVHAHKSGLKINGDSPGFGYARFYRALLEATGKLSQLCKAEVGKWVVLFPWTAERRLKYLQDQPLCFRKLKVRKFTF